MSPSHRLMQAVYGAFVLAVLAAPAAAQLSINFENPPYIPGSVQSQQGWSGGQNFPRVQTTSQITAELTAAGLNAGDAVQSGTQAMLVTYNPGETSGGLVGKSFTGLESEPHVVMDWWARPLTAGSAGSTIGADLGNTFVGIRDAAGNRAAAVRFGVIRDEADAITGTTIDFGASTTSVWVPSGLSWEADQWYNFRFELNYATKEYDFLINGTKVNAAPIDFYQASSTSATSVFISRGQNNAGQILDDFNVMTDFDKRLLLTIDPATGSAVVKNNSEAAISFDSYSIASSSNSLLANWGSLADQSMAGWQEAVPGTGRISELNPTGALTIEPGESIDFAGLWNTAGVQDVDDLSFRYRDPVLGTLTGAVEFASGVDGDFDDNNIVDGNDFLVWQRGGSPNPLSSADLAAWKANFGSSVPASASVASVPEPAAALLISLGLSFVMLNRRQR